MILQAYIKELQAICEKYPKAKVIYSSDDEGNNYELVTHEPSVGKFSDGEFLPEERFESGDKANAVCIN